MSRNKVSLLRAIEDLVRWGFDATYEGMSPEEEDLYRAALALWEDIMAKERLK